MQDSTPARGSPHQLDIAQPTNETSPIQQVSVPRSTGQVSLTSTVTDTYTASVPLDQIAAAAGRRVEALAVDPEVLRGTAPQRLVDLLAGHQDDESHLPAEEIVEVTGAVLAVQPTLAELIQRAWKVLQAESDTDQHSCAGQALAALLAGLRREELIS
jgi:hypothetical protein